ncbi:hypothetical protein AGR4C_Cc160235 [Agrobacterium tumefaciens str. Kerr 14]|uniref:Uncharacterized protein n=2 Tax=Agrobacterium TaxID=357 RepID=A0A1S7R7I0_9HYPH|nr:hypothetical protein AGR4C_Cc160235 [Agrobacterium tumefaciens str. Kerr 14]CUX48246.1 hypothetical protein AGR7C_Lc130057 [Agrobacterium deltaense Zutra 3/1]
MAPSVVGLAAIIHNNRGQAANIATLDLNVGAHAKPSSSSDVNEFPISQPKSCLAA